MSLVLSVSGDRWRRHLRSMAGQRPGLVPVIKGNGYGFGNHRLARRAQWLGADTIAVGTYEELSDVVTRFHGDVVVLTPWRPWIEVPDDPRIIHTVGRLEDLDVLMDRASKGARPRIVLERLTSMKRHGFTARGLRAAATKINDTGGVRLEGVSLHLPLGDEVTSAAEADDLLVDVIGAGLTQTTVWVSHLTAAQVDHLGALHPQLRFRPRVGTSLWLGDREALTATARVLDVHPVERGESYGYRRRSVPRTGHLVVVSGGTAHGIGLVAPTGEGSLRARMTTAARGGLDAVGLARSPFRIKGKLRYFAEPPHMQSSMVLLPGGIEPPTVGETVEVRVRFTTTRFDEVRID